MCVLRVRACVCLCVCVSSCLISFRDKDLDFSLKDFPPEASEVVLAFVTLSLLPQKPFALAPELCKIWSICYHSEFTPATAAARKDFSDDISSFLPR